ncbi:MAG: carbohydrate ABC transporter permease [Thermomicrobiales bacterium]
MLDRIKSWGALSTRVGILGVLTFFFAFPFVWMLITAFKRTSDLYDLKHNPFLFYEPPTLEHVKRLFFETLYGQWLLNTAFVGILVVLITLLLAVPAGYALARLTGNWGAKLGIGIFLTYLFPPTLLFIPLSRVVVNLHLDDSLWSLVLVYPSFTVPFSAWLMMGFFKAIPKDVEEAAMVDGYNRLGAFIRVVVPISWMSRRRCWRSAAWRRRRVCRVWISRPPCDRAARGRATPCTSPVTSPIRRTRRANLFIRCRTTGARCERGTR